MYQVDDKGFFGKFGGAYVPEILYKCVTELAAGLQAYHRERGVQERVLCAVEGLCGPSFTSLLCQAHEREVWLPALI